MPLKLVKTTENMKQRPVFDQQISKQQYLQSYKFNMV